MAGPNQPQYKLEYGDKVSTVMIYTINLLIWGDVITKEAIRVSIWLRTPSAPKYIFLHNLQVLTFGAGGMGKPQAFRELYLPTPQVAAFHLKPPASDPPDYDSSEANRKMEPATALLNSFRFDGFMRMSTQTTIDRYLDVAKDRYTGMYDVEISQPSIPSMGVIRVPFVLFQNDLVIFSAR